MAKLRKQFQAMDANNDGFITLDDMQSTTDVCQKNIRSSFRDSTICNDHPDLEKIFKSLDKNGDGKISYNEFVVGATDMSQLLNEENLRVAFDLLDLNGDGKITSEELRSRFV